MIHLDTEGVERFSLRHRFYDNGEAVNTGISGPVHLISITINDPSAAGGVLVLTNSPTLDFDEVFASVALSVPGTCFYDVILENGLSLIRGGSQAGNFTIVYRAPILLP